jgi:hypothetical protein
LRLPPRDNGPSPVPSSLSLSLSYLSHPPALTLSLSPPTTALLMPARVPARAVPASRRLARPPLSAETTGLAQS